MQNAWSHKSDEELVTATEHLAEYIDEGRAAIAREMRRRGMSVDKIAAVEEWKAPPEPHPRHAPEASLWYDSLEESERKFAISLRGKRDFWAWMYGVVLPILLLLLNFMILQEAVTTIRGDVLVLLVVEIAFVLLISIAFFMGQPWARNAFYYVAIGSWFLIGLMFRAEAAGRAFGGSIFPLIIYLSFRKIFSSIFIKWHELYFSA